MIELSVLKAPNAQVSMSTRKSIVPLFNPVPNGESVVRITCATEGVPTPEISWYKDGLPIPVSGRHHFATLIMEKNFTKQQLAIANIMGRDSVSVEPHIVVNVGPHILLSVGYHILASVGLPILESVGCHILVT